MDLLEYQAKTLFAESGIPILPSQQIGSLSDLRKLKIPYPVMLKSQVRAPGRGRAGGIRVAANTIDAVAAAQSIFRLAIRGHYPEVLLAESHYEVQRELYLAVILDHNARRPLLLGAATGGMEADLSPDQVVHVLVEEEFSPFYVRRLALGMGLSGALMRSVAAVAERMYQLFIQRDLDLVEINPLGVGVDGSVMALDGKVRVNDSALERHPMLLQSLQGRGPEMILPVAVAIAQEEEYQPHWCGMSGAVAGAEDGAADDVRDRAANGAANRAASGTTNGAVAVVCNGMGLTLATVDWVIHAGGQVAGFADVGWPTEGEGEASLGDRVVTAVARAIAESESDCPTVLIGLLGPAIDGIRLVRRLIDGLRRLGHWSTPSTVPQGTCYRGGRESVRESVREDVALMAEENGGAEAVRRSPTLTAPNQTLDSPSTSLNLGTLGCRRRWPKLVIHCSSGASTGSSTGALEDSQSLVEPYPIWLTDSLESAVDVSTVATVQ